MSESKALTAREREVLNSICHSGRGIKTAAYDLCLEPKTVRNHLTSIFRKIGVSDRGGACYRLGRADERKAQQR